ncbi:flagellin [soil metagenome]
MSSLLTNTSAMVALQTLRSINAGLDQTNNRVSTGLRVNSAADNAAYWSIATTIKSDNTSLSAVQDSLGLGKSASDATYAGLNSAKDLLDQIKSKLTTATGQVDRAKVQLEIDALLDQLGSVAAQGALSGDNWLSTGSSTNFSRQIVSSLSRDTNNSLVIGTIDVDITNIRLFGNGTTQTGIVDGTLSVDSFTTTAAYAATQTLTDEVFTFTVNQNGAHTVTINAATATAALGTTTIASANDYKLVLEEAFSAAGVTGIQVTADGGNVTFSSVEDFDLTVATEAAGGTGTVDATDMGLNAALAAAAGSFTGSVADIDISSATAAQVQDNLRIVDEALSQVTQAAASIGAVQNRITSQQTFVKAIMDAKTSAVGTLVDANMEEESTKLKALQTQQQLAVQSLSIANSSTQNILTLFRQ